MLLGHKPEALIDALHYGFDRYAKHERLEHERQAAGLPTDLERFLNNGFARD